MLTVCIDRTLDQPVYDQVADQLRRLIAGGTLEAGAALPPVRQLARDLGVNLNTIARAYRLLEGEGFLVIRHRTGVVVAPPADEIEASTRRNLLDEVRTLLARLRQAGMQTEELLSTIQLEVLALDGGPQEIDDE